MDLYDATKVRYLKQLHREHKKADNLPERDYALQQYREWVAAIGDPAIRRVLQLQPLGSTLLFALSFIGWTTVMSAIIAVGLLVWALVSWNMGLLLTGGVFVTQSLVASMTQTAINTELGARIQFVLEQGIAQGSEIAGSQQG
jgi:hypothetical protein